MKNNRNIFVIFLTAAVSIYACRCNSGKTDNHSDTTLTDSSTANIVDTAAFLEENNMQLATYNEIPENQTDTVRGSSVYYPVLTLKAGSKLIIPGNLENCEILIGKAYFEANTEIVADGKSGTKGKDRPNDVWITKGWWQAGANTDGAKGVSGGSGTTGTNATKSVKIKMGLMKLVTLNIHGNGGDGGDGGLGGTGQLGGNKKGPFGRNGDGGAGGDGGPGQNGGNGSAEFIVQIWPGSNSIDLPAAMQHIVLNAIGGKGGRGGAPGPGNTAGKNDGRKGSSGVRGRDGIDGKTTPSATKLETISRPPVP